MQTTPYRTRIPIASAAHGRNPITRGTFMKFIIKLIAFALALTTLGGVLAACRGGGDETDSGGSGNNGQSGSVYESSLAMMNRNG